MAEVMVLSRDVCWMVPERTTMSRKNYLLQQIYGGSRCRTLFRPSATDTFEPNAKHVATLAKSGGIIYIQANSVLHGQDVCASLVGLLSLYCVRTRLVLNG